MVFNTFPFCASYSTFLVFSAIMFYHSTLVLPLPSLFLSLLPFLSFSFLSGFVAFQILPMFLQNGKHFPFLVHMGPCKILPGTGVSHKVCTPLTWVVFSSRIVPHLREVFGHWDVLTWSQPVIVSYSPGTRLILFADTAAALTDREGQDSSFYNEIICMKLLRTFGEVLQLSQGNPWLSEAWRIRVMRFLQPAGFPESPMASDFVYNF